MPKPISVVLLNYNNSSVTLRCIDSLSSYLSSYLEEIIVVENKSSDDEIKRLIDGACDNRLVKVVFSERNLGFSGGCNLGVDNKSQNSSCLWFLNNDSWVDSDVGINQIIDLCKMKSTGLVGNSILLPNGKSTPNAGLRPTFGYMLMANIGLGKLLKRYGLYDVAIKLARINSNLKKLAEADKINSPGFVMEVYSVSGCSMFCSVDAYSRIGGLDNNYFIYDEDTDISIRSKSLGLRNYHVSDFKIYTAPHTTTSKYPEIMRAHRLNSRKYFINKYFAGIKRLILLATLMFFPKDW